MITYPLNNIDYTAEDAELYFSTRESGVYDGNDFEVTASGIDNDVIVGSGIAWIHNTKFSGKVVALKEPKTLTLSLPNSVYDRIDAIVVQFDANKNATEIIVKEGIASSSPIAPTVVRTESLYELHIFHVQRKSGATVISIDDLVDLRNDSDYCGIMFEPISSIDSTLTKSGYAADAAETGKQIKRAITVLNLLDNSDFTNPVNQRGGTSYTGNVYTVDRWMIWSDTLNATVEIEDDGLKLNAGTSKKMCIVQYFEKGYLSADNYTLAWKTADGVIHINNNPVISETSRDYIEIVPNASCKIVWAALYEGEYTAETLPPYVRKGYAAEVAECIRYYCFGGRYYSHAMTKYNLYNSAVKTLFPMRAKPTITLVSPSTNAQNRIYCIGVGDIDSYSVTVDSFIGGVVASPNGGFVPNNEYTWYAYFSADL